MSAAKILIVDDEADFAQLLAFDLKKRGYQTVLAGNGEEGLAKFGAEKPQAVIFDIKMPRMDGYTFVRSIKKSPEAADTPLIALTSYDMKDIFEIEGVKYYFMKAAKMEGLFDALAKLFPGAKNAS